ncbi:DNA-binding transcriptional regulator, LysR family [Amycolatopsis arida]|uniref:DNA-binding transcriptional regulator, LysR family n=1 Tax=Amycolatopsis arida TaxID=587909 RepID=A0A1I6ALY2_9PSEU|nr:LysR family transcriptional regulator [Amycolatopsis arida]TDX87392.1 DNA-binding transcriptional LysR family regulator [Amycolatopsis arida]SFQ69704.1 DNA-binding transcriptional regulator, LysR family [Amycolatopsis arida]
MDVARLRNLDLNLLLALDALLEERNVSRAAHRVGVSQPSMSAALARLRRHFGDELLQRSGNRYHHTALAAQLAGRTKAALVGVQRVFDAAPDFDPAVAEREFTLIVSDYGAAVLGEHLAELVARQAPKVRLRFEYNVPQAVDNIEDTLRAVDGIVMPHGILSDLPTIDLYEDSWSCVVSEDNDVVGDAPTLDDLANLPWVATYRGPTAYTPAVRQLQMLGIEPNVHIVVESFLAVPFLVSGTSRVAVLQTSLARRLAVAAGIRVLPCPWGVVPLKEAFWWHPLYDTDPAHTWLRGALTDAGRAVTDHYGCARS